MGRTDRNRMSEFRDALDLRDRSGPSGTARESVQIIDLGSIPTTVPRVFAARPVVFDSPDVEGAGYTVTPDTAVTLYVVCLGPRVPVAGDLLVAHAVGGRLGGSDKTQ
jgi:hypothetical protein